MTRTEYDGDNPLRLANEIDAALAKYGLGSDRRVCKAIHFFEGELRLIAECLRCGGPQKVAKQSPSSTRGVDTREEIEKYLKQLKGTQTAASMSKEMKALVEKLAALERRQIDAGRRPLPRRRRLRLD